MTRAAKITLRLLFVLALASPGAWAQQAATTPDAVQIAEEEAVRRAEATIRLHMLLDQAIAAQKRGQLAEAARLYQEAVILIPGVQVGNPAVEMEKKQAVSGLDTIREKLARDAMARGDMADALTQVETALKWDPNNENLRKLKLEIDVRTAQSRGHVPSPDFVKMVPEIEQQKVDIGTKIQNAKLLYEMGKYDDAEAILNQVVKADPSNKTAPYYLESSQGGPLRGDHAHSRGELQGGHRQRGESLAAPHQTGSSANPQSHGPHESGLYDAGAPGH